MRRDTLHCHVDNVSRRRTDGGEQSAVARAAYISGSAVWSERQQKTIRFDGRSGVVHSEIVAPEGAPPWVQNRSDLWNRVEAHVRRRDARLAKTIEAALPRAVPASDHVPMLRDFVAPYVAAGMVADIAVHEDGTGHNPHIHVLLTVYLLKPEGFSSKIADADLKSFVTQARRGWETVCNSYLTKHGSALRLDRRSFKARGLADIPSTHRGPGAEGRARGIPLSRPEVAMPNRPSVEDRQDFPLLSRRPDWPPLSERPAPDMSFGERQELARFWESRTAAEEASRESWRQSGVAETFAKHVDRDVRTPDPSRLSPPEPDRVEPAPDDFFVAALDVERMEEARAYDRELWSRAVNLNRTREENRLIERAARVSPELQEAMKERLFQLRIDRLRQEDAQKNLEAFATRLDPDLREEFDRHATSRTWDQYPLPEPGPYGRPTAAIELNRARSDMLETYERDPEPDR